MLKTLKTPFKSLLVLLTISTILSACIPQTVQQDNKMSNLYQHRWILTSNPDVDQDIHSIAKYLANFDVVFFGELHTHPGAHLAQMLLLEAMVELNPEITLSMEQFERDTQSYLDDYLAGKIGERHLIKKTRAWDNYETSYRPLVEFAKHNQLPVIAANAPKDIVICVGRFGLDFLDKISSQNRKHIAQEIDVSAGAYRDKFFSFLAKNPSHGGGHKKSNGKETTEMSAMMQKMSERSFAAQVVRDDTMAESIARHLHNNPQRQVLHLNGVFHSSQFLGAVERLKNRMPELKIAVIETVPLTVNNKNWRSDKLKHGNILLLVKRLPVAFVNTDNKREWSKAILEKRRAGRENCAALKQTQD